MAANGNGIPTTSRNGMSSRKSGSTSCLRFFISLFVFLTVLILASCSKREVVNATRREPASAEVAIASPAIVPLIEQNEETAMSQVAASAGQTSTSDADAMPGAAEAAEQASAETGQALIEVVTPASLQIEVPTLIAPAPAKPFSVAANRAAFERSLLEGSFVSGVDMAGDNAYSAIDSWALAVQEAGGLDETIERFSAAAEAKDAPPHVSFALAALYSRKGLIQKQYAALLQSEQAAKSRPDIVFALAAVYGRKDTLKASYSADELLVGSLRAESTPSGARVFVDGIERGASPLSIEKLSEGAHTLRIDADGFTEWRSTIEVTTGQETKVAAKLGIKPSDPHDMNVVHYNFSEKSIDSTIWITNESIPGQITQKNGIFLTTSSKVKNSQARIEYRKPIIGNFDAQINFEIINGWERPNVSRNEHLDGAYLGVNIDYNNRIHISRITENSNDKIGIYWLVDNPANCTEVFRWDLRAVNDATKGKYRINRNGLKYIFSIDLGSGWKELYSFEKRTITNNKIHLYFGAGSVDMIKQFTTKFTDFSISQ
jgi:hypothetical protein